MRKVFEVLSSIKIHQCSLDIYLLTPVHTKFSVLFLCEKSKKSFVYNAMWLCMVVIGFVNRNYEHIVVCRRPDATREETSAPPKSLCELRH